MLKILERGVEGPDIGGQVVLFCRQFGDVVALNGQFGRAKDHIVIDVLVQNHLVGIGRLQRMLDLPGREFGGFILYPQLVQTLGHRQIVPGPEVGRIGRGINQSDLDRGVLCASVWHRLGPHDGLHRFQLAFGVHFAGDPVITVLDPRQFLERQGRMAVGPRNGAQGKRRDQRCCCHKFHLVSSQLKICPAQMVIRAALFGAVSALGGRRGKDAANRQQGNQHANQERGKAHHFLTFRGFEIRKPASRTIAVFLLNPGIKRHRTDDYKARRDRLPEKLDPQRDQRIQHHRQQQNARERPDDRRPPAKERCAPHNHRRNDVQVEKRGHRRLNGVLFAGQHQTRQRRASTAQHIGIDLVPLDPDAGQFRRFRAGADGDGIAAKMGALEDVITRHHGQHPDHRRCGNEKRGLAAPNLGQDIGKARQNQPLGQQERQTFVDEVHRQRADQVRHVKARDDQPVDQAQQRSDAQGNRNAHIDRKSVLFDQECHDDRGQNGHRPHGQINAALGDDKGHRHRHRHV
mmetsp:Transcript_28731/g.54418  ORF Transcript_28731/g.54418 Transcript_28731/m.54418 type:complete len:518 (-) Transcript_28731:4698-6251(-)